MNIQFLGASGEVTGSSFLLSGTTDQQLLIDMGMFQGSDVVHFNYLPLGFDAKKLLGVFVTHAHLDHCGRLPLLVQAGFMGKIYMTEPTKMLVQLALLDAAKIAKEHPQQQQPALYTEQEVEKVFQQVQIVTYDSPLILGEFAITFTDAGHILGSASLQITDTKAQKTVVFSGDLGNSPQDLIRPTEKITRADVVVMEATYGDRIHPVDNSLAVLQKEINAVEASGGVLLIPAFSLDRSQNLLHKINHLKRDNKIKRETPVFLDSPMAIKATAIYTHYSEFWSNELKSHTDNPFDFPGLSIVQEAQDSKKIDKMGGAKVIIAGNGMMTGGRITHHAIQYLPLPTTRLLIVGYQGEGTIGRLILEGKRQVHMLGQEIAISATVTDVEGLSAHADQPKLLAWLGSIADVQEVYIVHGENTAREAYKEMVITELKLINITLPAINEIKEL